LHNLLTHQILVFTPLRLRDWRQVRHNKCTLCRREMPHQRLSQPNLRERKSSPLKHFVIMYGRNGRDYLGGCKRNSRSRSHIEGIWSATISLWRVWQRWKCKPESCGVDIKIRYQRHRRIVFLSSTSGWRVETAWSARGRESALGGLKLSG